MKNVPITLRDRPNGRLDSLDLDWRLFHGCVSFRINLKVWGLRIKGNVSGYMVHGKLDDIGVMSFLLETVGIQPLPLQINGPSTSGCVAL